MYNLEYTGENEDDPILLERLRRSGALPPDRGVRTTAPAGESRIPPGMAMKAFQLPPVAQPTFDADRFDPNLDPQRFPQAPNMPRGLQPQQADYDVTPSDPIPRAADLGTAPPLPPKRRTALEEFDALQARRPGPATGVRGHALDFFAGGLPGLAVGFLDKSRDARQRYQEDLQMLPLRQRIEHQQALEKETEANTALRAEQIADIRANRKTAAEDRDADRDARAAAAGLEDREPGELEQATDPTGKYPAYSQVRIGERTYRRPSRYLLTAEAQAAKEAGYEQVPDVVARGLGMPLGTKLPPERMVALYQTYETHNKNQERTPEAQIAFRKKVIGLTGLRGRDAQVYLATGNIERPASVNVSMLNRRTDDQSNVTAIADAIESGDQPPEMTSMYHLAGPVRAELGRRNYSLSQAQTDWRAMQRHMTTLNGPQQERLRQAVAFTTDSLDNIQNLYDEWLKSGAATQFKAVNRAALVASSHLPSRAGEIATRLQAQINDLASELGTVYKGGNSSTDESLKLAAGNLKGEWNERTFKGALSDIRRNLQIRRNSMVNSPAAGVSPGSPYQRGGAREEQPAAPPALPDKPANGYTRMRAPAPHDSEIMDVPNNRVDVALKLGATKVK